LGNVVHVEVSHSHHLARIGEPVFDLYVCQGTVPSQVDLPFDETFN